MSEQELIVNLLRDGFTQVNARLDEMRTDFRVHVADDQMQWQKADKAHQEARGVKRLLHLIWLGGTAVAGFIGWLVKG